MEGDLRVQERPIDQDIEENDRPDTVAIWEQEALMAVIQVGNGR